MSDLVAAEAKYHKSYRSSFENLPSGRLTPRCLTSEQKINVFLSMCPKFEDEMEVYTLTELHEAMGKLGTEVYSLKMTKEKLEKFEASIQFKGEVEAT